MSRRKSKPDRLAIEARRRVTDATRIATQGAADRLAGIRHTLAAAARLAAALAVTDEFAWKPWGYELDRPVVRPSVPQLRLVHSRPRVEREPGARELFARRQRRAVAA